MGNLIFKPISRKLQPPICSVFRSMEVHYG